MAFSKWFKIVVFPVAILALLVWFYFDSATQRAEDPYVRTYGIKYLQENDLDTMIVARIGDRVITGEEFYTSYEMGPSFVKRRFKENPRKAHLEFMVYEKLFAANGLKDNILDRADTELLLAEIKGDLAVTEMFREDVYEDIVVDPELLKKTVEEATINLRFKVLYSEKETQIAFLQSELANGISFDTLSNRFGGQYGFGSGSKSLNYWELKQSDADFAAQLAELPFHQQSDVIRTAQGFYIAWLDTAWREPIITPVKYNDLSMKYHKRLKKIQTENAAYEYAAERFDAARAIIKAPALNQLIYYFQYNEAADRPADELQAPLGNWPGQLNMEGLADLSAPLVTSEIDTFTIQDFLNWYGLRRFPLNRASENSLINSLRSIVARMVRDRALIHEANQRNYDQHPRVKRETNWWREKLSYWLVREALVVDINIDAPAVAAFYEKHSHRYKEAISGHQLSLEEAQETVAREAFIVQERQRLMRYLSEEQKAVSIKTYEEKLAKIPVSDITQSKPIDLFAVKKNGTLPRILYPTIDQIWERY